MQLTNYYIEKNILCIAQNYSNMTEKFQLFCFTKHKNKFQDYL